MKLCLTRPISVTLPRPQLLPTVTVSAGLSPLALFQTSPSAQMDNTLTADHYEASATLPIRLLASLPGHLESSRSPKEKLHSTFLEPELKKNKL